KGIIVDPDLRNIGTSLFANASDADFSKTSAATHGFPMPESRQKIMIKHFEANSKNDIKNGLPAEFLPRKVGSTEVLSPEKWPQLLLEQLSTPSRVETRGSSPPSRSAKCHQEYVAWAKTNHFVEGNDSVESNSQSAAQAEAQRRRERMDKDYNDWFKGRSSVLPAASPAPASTAHSDSVMSGTKAPQSLARSTTSRASAADVIDSLIEHKASDDHETTVLRNKADEALIKQQKADLNVLVSRIEINTAERLVKKDSVNALNQIELLKLKLKIAQGEAK
ncbi:hypothetical protein LTR16_008174, partial [Cryomyces antarcticus]